MKRKIIVAQGKIEVEKRSPACIHRDKCDIVSFLVGGFRTKTGFTSLNAIDHALEGLNGEKVKLIIEVTK